MLYYGLVCTAISEDRQQLREGMRLIADMAHKYKIPITWAITADSAQFLAKDLTNWHNEYKDEPLLMLDIKSTWNESWTSLIGQSSTVGGHSDSRPENLNISTASAAHVGGNSDSHPEVIAEQLVKMRETLPRKIRTEWKKMERALEWATPGVVGAIWKNHVFVQALEQNGFRGLWGYRWDERGSDGEVDRGCPYGIFYPSSEQHNFSAPTAGSITGIPYRSAEHLNNVGGNSDSRNVGGNSDSRSEEYNLRAALINNKTLLNYDLYLENENWNRWLCYIEHVYALEVTQLGQETLTKLDEYFEYVAENERTKVLPLSEIVDDYWTNCQQTEPTIIVTNIKNADNQPESKPVGGNSDSRKVIYYYDAECQLTFYDGVMEPAEMKNYITSPLVDDQGRDVPYQSTAIHGTEYHLPKVADFRPIRKRSRLHLTWTIESTKAMPYGIVIWGNHLGLQLAKSNAKEVMWVDKYLLFIRLALEPGNNEFEIVLTI